MDAKRPDAKFLEHAERFAKAVDIAISILEGVPESEQRIAYSRQLKAMAMSVFDEDVLQVTPKPPRQSNSGVKSVRLGCHFSAGIS